MPDGSLPAEDAKLVTLARAARARSGATEGAAVRDGDGRTYAGAGVDLPSLKVSALQYAVASAVNGGTGAIEAAAVVTDAGELDPAGRAAVHEVTAGAPIHLASPSGELISTYLD